MESWLFLLAILVVAWLGKNQSLQIATVVVLLIKLIPNTSKLLTTIGQKGINLGCDGDYRRNFNSDCDWSDWISGPLACV